VNARRSVLAVAGGALVIKSVKATTPAAVARFDNFAPFVEYLVKTEAERRELPEDTHESWAILGDSGNTGPDTNTPGLRVIALRKPSQLQPSEREDQAALARTRVPVEAAFGRVKKKSLESSAHRTAGSKHFDMTFDLALLLMNEAVVCSRTMRTSMPNTTHIKPACAR
jgi:hypothetical protein